jgi:glutamine synthetase
MMAPAMADSTALADWLADRDVAHVHVGASDHLGIWRGKRMASAAFVAAAGKSGVAFSEGLFGLDIAGAWVDPPAGHPGWYPSARGGYPDMFLQLAPETATVAPWLHGEAFVLGSWHLHGGAPVPVDPRACLRRCLDALAARGLRLRCGLEFELYVLAEPIEALAAGGFAAPRPIHHRAYPYHALRAAVDLPLLEAISAGLAGAGVAVEALSFENGIGQLELNVRYDDALRAADTAFMAKQAIRAIASQRGMTATFMAKPFAAEPGSSCHVHLSLWTPDGGANVLEQGPPGELGDLAAHAVAGLHETLAAVTGLCLPSANSYARLVPDALAPLVCNWAPESRTVALRTIPAPAGISRVEHRLPGADVNPYLALAAFAAGILVGIDGRLRPPAPAGGEDVPAAAPIPATPEQAAAALVADARLAERLGQDVVALQALMLRAEAEAARTRVSDADRARYLELA